MTGHWEFTYAEQEILANIEAFEGEFLAQNVKSNVRELEGCLNRRRRLLCVAGPAQDPRFDAKGRRKLRRFD